MIALDVGADGGASFLQGLELAALDEPFFELGKPALDESLTLGVAVAVPAVSDAE